MVHLMHALTIRPSALVHALLGSWDFAGLDLGDQLHRDQLRIDAARVAAGIPSIHR